jgi:hypothetical protein
MTKFSKFLITTAIVAVALPTGAMAAAVTGSSSGAFSGVTSCDSTCIISSVAGGTNNKFQWGADTRDQDPSTLIADNINIGPLSTTTNNVVIGELTWHNTPINSDDGVLDSINVNYKLTISFTGGTGDNETFPLNILNTTNSAGDIISSFTAADLSDLSFVIPGWTVSNLAYSVDGAAVPVCDDNGHNCHSVSPTFGGSCGANQWCNPEGDTSDLFITATFTPTVTHVPEPMTLSLFGAGLAGAAAMRLRRRKKA